MGQALKDGYRNKVFLMTKMDGRTAKEYNKQLEESLGRLQTDVIDLVQFHEIIRMEDPDRIFAEGGAIEPPWPREQAGKIRYIGFTGHKDPAVHLRMLEVAAEARLPLRHRADARQRHGRPLPLLHQAGHPRRPEAGHRRPRHEDLRRQLSSSRARPSSPSKPCTTASPSPSPSSSPASTSLRSSIRPSKPRDLQAPHPDRDRRPPRPHPRGRH